MQYALDHKKYDLKSPPRAPILLHQPQTFTERCKSITEWSNGLR